jgi:hypothetical protein
MHQSRAAAVKRLAHILQTMAGTFRFTFESYRRSILMSNTLEQHTNRGSLQGMTESQHQGGLGADTAPERGVRSGQRGEGPVARAIEEQTSRLPSDFWLWAAGGSIALSLYLQTVDEKQKALFVGNWAPTFLLLGIYNKLVKLHGSD